MKRTASVERASRLSVSSRRGKQANSRATYVMCVNNESNPESLELRKIYRAMRDAEGAKHGYIRAAADTPEDRPQSLGVRAARLAKLREMIGVAPEVGDHIRTTRRQGEPRDHVSPLGLRRGFRGAVA